MGPPACPTKLKDRRRAALFLYLLHPEAQHPSWHRDFHLVAYAPLQQRLAHRRDAGDLAIGSAGLRGPYDGVPGEGPCAQILYQHRAPPPYPAALLRPIRHYDPLQDPLYLPDPRLQVTLLLLGGIQGSVLTEVFVQ